MLTKPGMLVNFEWAKEAAFFIPPIVTMNTKVRVAPLMAYLASE